MGFFQEELRNDVVKRMRDGRPSGHVRGINEEDRMGKTKFRGEELEAAITPRHKAHHLPVPVQSHGGRDAPGGPGTHRGAAAG